MVVCAIASLWSSRLASWLELGVVPMKGCGVGLVGSATQLSDTVTYEGLVGRPGQKKLRVARKEDGST
jgi:hypothetical protein